MATFSRPMTRLAVNLGLALLVAIAASGCGRKGSLERPSSPNVVKSDNDGNVKETKPEKPDKPFFLDPLL